MAFQAMRSEKLLLFILAAIQFTNIVDFMIMMPLGPQLMRLFDISPRQFSLLVSAYTFSAGIFGFLAAFQIDKFDRKTALLFVYSGFLLGTFACALAPGYEWLIAARVFTGAFGGVLGALVLSVVGDTIPIERRATAMGLVTAAFSVASVFGVPFSLFIASVWSWHAPFLFLATSGLLILFGIWKWVPKMNKHVQIKTNRITPFALIASVAKEANLRLALLLMMTIMLGNFIVTPFISPYMVANVGFTEKELTYIYLFGGLLTIFTSPWIGKLSDRFGPKKVYIIFVFINLIPLLLITNLPITPIPIVLLITTSFFIVSGGRMITSQTMIAGAVDPSKRGAFMSFNSSVQQLSTAFASLLAGLIVTKNDAGQLQNYQYVGIIAAVLSLISILIVKRVKSVS